jgi:hypothetical protein
MIQVETKIQKLQEEKIQQEIPILEKKLEEILRLIEESSIQRESQESSREIQESSRKREEEVLIFEREMQGEIRREEQEAKKNVKEVLKPYEIAKESTNNLSVKATYNSPVKFHLFAKL